MCKNIVWLGTSSLAFLLAAACCGAGTSHDAPLSDSSLDSIRGLNDMSRTYTAGQSCELTTEKNGGPVSSDTAGCFVSADYTACVQCTAGSAVTPIPNTTGGPGISQKGSTIACSNATANGGYCYQGVCELDNWPTACSGSPTAWQTE